MGGSRFEGDAGCAGGTFPETSGSTSPATSPKPWQFQKGNPGPRGLKKQAGPDESPEEDQPEGDASDADRLKDMQWVYRNPKRKTRNESRVRLQAWFADAPAAFMTMLERLEAKRDEAAKSAEGEATDLGTEKLRALGEGILDRIGNEMREEALRWVQDGRCACCGGTLTPNRGEAGKALDTIAHFDRVRAMKRECGG